MSKIIKQDTEGTKPLLQVGEFGYDNWVAGGDIGRVYVGTGSSNIAIAKKAEVTAVDSKADTHIVRVDNPHGVTKAQVGLGNADNTADNTKVVASAGKLTTARNIALGGDVTGTVSFDGSADVTIVTTIAANSVALGTDTTGNYVAGVTAGTGITVGGTAGEGWTPSVAITNVGIAGTYTKVTTNAQGQVTNGATLSAGDIPSLDASKITSGVIDAARLPAYVDDVLEFANLAGFPAVGETGKIYVALDTNKAYRWSGSAYIYITSGAVDSVAGKTGVVTLVKADVGLANVDNTSDANKPVSTAVQSELDTKQDVLVSGTNVKTIEGQSIVGSGNIDLSKSAVGLDNVDNTADSLKVVASAGKWTTSRLINGTAVDGTIDITTSQWGTSRNITIGNTPKTVNGSGDVSWSLAEIGAIGVSSPTFTGIPLAPTAAVGTNTTQLATTAFVNAEIANDAVPRVASTDNAVVRFDGVTGQVQNSNVVIDDNGNVGIGTSSPTDKLTMYSASGNLFSKIQSGTSTLLTGVYSDGTTCVNTLGNYPLMLLTNNTERMKIDNNGNVGIGDSAPQYKLSIGQSIPLPSTAGSKITAFSKHINVGNASYLRFDTVRTSAGSSHNSSEERIRKVIDVSEMGYIGFGDNNVVFGNADGKIATISATGLNVDTGAYTANNYWSNSSKSAGTDWMHFYGTSNNNSVMNIIIYGNGNIVNANNSYGALSDIKLKENIIDVSPKLDKLMKVRVVNYNLIGQEQKQIGVIAQEIEQIFPGLIDETKDTKQVEIEKERLIPALDEIVDNDGNVVQEAKPEYIEKYMDIETIETGETTKSVKYSVLYMIMLKGMQEQQEIINSLVKRVETLEGAK